MKFVQRWIAKKLKWYWDNHENLLGYPEDAAVYVSNKNTVGRPRLVSAVNSDGFGSQLRGNPVEMKIHMANGGYVIEFYRYDVSKDRSSIETYVIDDSVDKLGENIAQIVVQYTIQNR